MVQAVAVTRSRISIRFLPDDRRWDGDAPVPLALAAASAGILLEQPCAGDGTCGECRVRVHAGDAPETDADRALLSATERAEGWRLGCQLVCHGNLLVEVPSLARAAAGKSFGEDLASDALCRPVLDVSAWQRLTSRPSGLAVDIGTTSLAVAVVDLRDGSVRASAAVLNPQSAFGRDVIARIKFAGERDGGARRLTAAIREAIRGVGEALMTEAGVEPGDVLAAAVAGNPTMMHLWAGLDPAGLGVAPYAGQWPKRFSMAPRDLDLPIHPDAGVFAFPVVGSHVGGDLAAAAVACGFDLADQRRLLIDLGTNSEVVVTDGRRVVAASGAAGPAFEGVSIRDGMRAAPGAIDGVVVDDEGRLVVTTIGNAPAVGICGSGLIDLLAELRRVGVVDASGYLRRATELPAQAAPLAARIEEVDGQRAFRLTERVVFTARDIREVQLAKGSIRAGIALCCRHLGFEPEALTRIDLAGAFGNFIRKRSARGIGLVPEVDPQRIHFVGNAAGVGARLALLDRGVRERAAALAARAHHLDLASCEDYQNVFMDSLML